MVARLNDYEIKVVKLKGEFVWHTHDDTDELFLVVDVELTIQMRDGDVRLKPGQLFVVPKGRGALPDRGGRGSCAAHRASRGRQHPQRRP